MEKNQLTMVQLVVLSLSPIGMWPAQVRHPLLANSVSVPDGAWDSSICTHSAQGPAIGMERPCNGLDAVSLHAHIVLRCVTLLDLGIAHQDSMILATEAKCYTPNVLKPDP